MRCRMRVTRCELHLRRAFLFRPTLYAHLPRTLTLLTANGRSRHGAQRKTYMSVYWILSFQKKTALPKMCVFVVRFKPSRPCDFFHVGPCTQQSEIPVARKWFQWFLHSLPLVPLLDSTCLRLVRASSKVCDTGPTCPGGTSARYLEEHTRPKAAWTGHASAWCWRDAASPKPPCPRVPWPPE